MRETHRGVSGVEGRLLGYVHLEVGSQVFALPVQAVPLKRADGTTAPGGFFAEASGQFGIIVDSEAPEWDIQAQIQRASADAVRHISRKVLN